MTNLPKYHQLINTSLKGCKVEWKFLLIAFCHFQDENERCVLSTKEMARKFGVSGQVTIDALRYFRDEGWLIRIPVNREVNGAARFKYEQGQFPENTKIPTITMDDEKRSHIDQLIKVNTYQVRNAKGKWVERKIRTSTRMLLMVLHANSDSSGRIENLGYADMAKYTGMTRDRVREQIRKLKSNLFITKVCPGISGKFLFGKRKAIYMLNLNHNLHKEQSNLELTAVYNFKTDSFFNSLSLFQYAKHLNSSNTSSYSFQHLDKFFPSYKKVKYQDFIKTYLIDIPESNVCFYLQYIIESFLIFLIRNPDKYLNLKKYCIIPDNDIEDEGIKLYLNNLIVGGRLEEGHKDTTVFTNFIIEVAVQWRDIIFEEGIEIDPKGLFLFDSENNELNLIKVYSDAPKNQHDEDLDAN